MVTDLTTATPTSMALNFTPTELSLLAAAVNEKIAWLDESMARLREQADEADAFTMLVDAQDVNRLMRAVYGSMVRRIEQALDVPFVDHEAALEALLAR